MINEEAIIDIKEEGKKLRWLQQGQQKPKPVLQEKERKNVEKEKVEERTEKQITEQNKEKNGILPKRAASTAARIRRKNANY
eukprot:2654335-Ditylum_brightwellii.AAC.1